MIGAPVKILRKFSQLLGAMLLGLGLFACVGGGGGAPGGVGGPVEVAGDPNFGVVGQAAAPEHDTGTVGPVTDWSPCDAYLDGEAKVLEETPDTKKVHLKGYIQIPIKEEKPFTLPGGKVTTKLDCVGFRDSESERSLRIHLRDVNRYVEIPLRNNQTSSPEGPMERTGYVDSVYDFPKALSWWIYLSPVDYNNNGQYLTDFPCPAGETNCLEFDNWLTVFNPLLKNPQIFNTGPLQKTQLEFAPKNIHEKIQQNNNAAVIQNPGSQLIEKIEIEEENEEPSIQEFKQFHYQMLNDSDEDDDD